MIETRQYFWLRITVLGTGAALLASLILASTKVWPIVQRAIWPTRLSCGCAVLSVNTPWWLTAFSIGVIAITAFMILRSSLLFFNKVKRSHQQIKLMKLHGTKPVTNLLLKMKVTMVETDELFAVTAGMFQPKIYVSSGLINNLTDEEYQAVLAHERAHKKSFDPLVTAFMETISAVWRFIPGARGWMAAAYSLRELSADAAATNNYKSTEALSSAFVKLSDAVVHPAGNAFSPNRDRLEKLLDNNWMSSRKWWNWAGAGAVMFLMAGTLLFGKYVQAKSPIIPPAAAAACHETMVMCRADKILTIPVEWRCASGSCDSPVRYISPLYAISTAR